MRIREIMTTAPICCSPDAKLDAVARLMLEHDCGEIPVCDGKTLVGVVTDRDIAVRGLATRKNPFETPVSTIMTAHPYTVGEDAPLDSALMLMEKHQVRRVPVTRDGKVVGIVSQADLIASLPSVKIAELLGAVSRPPAVATD